MALILEWVSSDAGLGVTTDSLIFEDEERGPSDELKLQLELISRFDENEKKIVKALLGGVDS